MQVLSERYELGTSLGAGGMAEVVEGYDRLLDRRVAVKLMRSDLGADSSVRDRFVLEARAAAKLAHPNAVAVYDTGVDGRQPWIVMELVDGHTLADRLADQGPLEPGEAVRITVAVLSALHAAHRSGLVHRDVKPANILLPADGGVKLADFGIAKGVQQAAAGLTATGQVIGTAKYLSPEQVNGQAATPATDVYAVGVVLYEMLTGAPPFDADSPVAVALAHINQPPPSLRRRRRGIDPALARIVERALAKDPAMRFADADDMRAALASVAPAGALVPPAVPSAHPASPASPAPSTTPGPSGTPSAPGSGRRAAAAGAAAVGGAALSGDAVAGAADGAQRRGTTPAAATTAVVAGAGSGRDRPTPTRRRRGLSPKAALLVLGVVALVALGWAALRASDAPGAGIDTGTQEQTDPGAGRADDGTGAGQSVGGDGTTRAEEPAAQEQPAPAEGEGGEGTAQEDPQPAGGDTGEDQADNGGANGSGDSDERGPVDPKPPADRGSGDAGPGHGNDGGDRPGQDPP